MKLRHSRPLWLFILLLSLTTLSCGIFGLSGDGPPRNAVVVDVVANTSLRPWLETAVASFNESETETAAGDPAYVQVSYVESGQAVVDLSQGAEAALWLPEEPVWASVLADQGNDNFQGDCVSVAKSPLVIGMWREVAESLGWPGLPLGWLDIGSLAADPAAWDYYSGGELGDSFRMGHTHPGLSGTGASTLLAIVQAAESKTTPVDVADIQQPIVQASVGAFEGGVTWFSSSTDLLGQTMAERGLDYLGAAVMFESTVVQYGGDEIVAVYPLEGTFMATFPACLNQTADAETTEAAVLFREYLLGIEGQQQALASGLRPVSDEVPFGPPLTAVNGVDPDQPTTIFAPPSVDAVYAIQELWQEARKDVNLVMLLDTSGSMRGSKIENMQAAAVQFVQQMGDDDYISVIAFHTVPELIVNHVQVGENRDKIVRAIEDLQAVGDTTLFDAIGDGAELLVATGQVETTNAMVVLTDGQDTASTRYNADTALADAVANNTTVFTIAYGGDADERVLERLATRANGNFFVGDEASIAAIYDEMSAAFGGSVGVGR